MMLKLIKNINQFFSCKFIFKKPNKKPILIIDGIANPFSNYFKEITYNIYYRRFEEINIPVLWDCIIELDLSPNNYLKNFLKYAKPLVLLTFIDNNPSFYQYSKYYGIKTIFVQYGTRTYYEDIFSNKKINNSKNKNKNFVDYMFVFNQKIGEIFQNFIQGKIIEIGSFKNNFKNYKNKKKSEILYISGFRGKNLDNYYKDDSQNDFYKNDKYFVKWLYNESKKNNLKFNILGKSIKFYREEKKFFEKFTETKKINFIKNFHLRRTYEIMSKYKYVFAIESTLAIENLSKNGRTGFFFNRPYRFPINSRSFGYMEGLKPNGKFWTTDSTEKKFEKVFNFVIYSKNKDWNKAIKKIKKIVMPLDIGNKKFLKVVNEIISK